MSATAFQRRRREQARQQAASKAKAAPVPDPGTPEHYATLKAEEVLEQVEAGVFTREAALELEHQRPKPRKTVVEALEPEGDEGGDDGADDEPAEAPDGEDA